MTGVQTCALPIWGEAVPDVLLSGDHARVDRWRLEQAVQRTLELRPDRLSDRETLPDGLGDLVEALDSGADST